MDGDTRHEGSVNGFANAFERFAFSRGDDEVLETERIERAVLDADGDGVADVDHDGATRAALAKISALEVTGEHDGWFPDGDFGGVGVAEGPVVVAVADEGEGGVGWPLPLLIDGGAQLSGKRRGASIVAEGGPLTIGS